MLSNSIRPLTPGAARIKVEAANEPVNVKAVVERLQAVVEGLQLWLKDDVSSSDEVDTEHPPTLNLEMEDDRGQLKENLKDIQREIIKRFISSTGI